MADRNFHLKAGRFGEKTARRFLESKNYRILAQNWRTRTGELDLVSLDGECVVFVEVKTRCYRKKSALFRPAQNLSNYQMRRNRHAAKLYRKIFHATHFEARFDLVEVCCDRRLRITEIYHTRDYLPILTPEPIR